jgi:hypothetical protein
MDVVGLANRIPNMLFGFKSVDDFSDRVNYRYTVALLIFFSVILTTKQYGSNDVSLFDFNLQFFNLFLIFYTKMKIIKCWVPAHFTCKTIQAFFSKAVFFSDTI